MASAWEVFKESYGTLFQFYRETFQVQCSRESLELGIESGIVTYFLTRLVFKRPHQAFRNGSAAVLLVPSIYWPFCRIQEKKLLLESGVTVVDTQKEIESHNKDAKPREQDHEQIKIDTA